MVAYFLRGAHSPIIPLALFIEREGELRGLPQLMVHLIPVVIDGAGVNGSAEDRWRKFYNILGVQK